MKKKKLIKQIKEQELKRHQLKEAAFPLIKYLCDNYHPHITAIVTPTGVEIVEGVMTVQNIHHFIND